MAGQTTGSASALLNTAYIAGIIAKARERSEVLALPTNRYSGLRSRVVKRRVETAGVSPDWLATETTHKPISKPTIGEITLSPHKCALTTWWSDTLAIASEEGYEAFIRRTIEASVAEELERIFIGGVAASDEPTGLLNLTLAAGFQIAYTSGRIGDLVDTAITKLRQAKHKADTIILPPTLLNELAIERTATEEAYMNPGIRESRVYRGLRIVESNFIPTPAATQPETAALIVDRSRMHWAEWAGASLAFSSQATLVAPGGTVEVNLWQQDASAARFTAEYDLVLTTTDSMVRLVDIPVTMSD